MKRILSIMLAMLLLGFAVAAYAGGSQYPLATRKLSLRSAPTTGSEDIGTYDMAGETVEAIERCLDGSNGFYWLHVCFRYNGEWIDGWTGSERFDSSSYDIDRIPEK